MAGMLSTAMIVTILCLTSVAASVGDTVQGPIDSHVTSALVSTMDVRALKASGQQLRRELNTVYKELGSHSREIPNRPDSRDITDTAIRFLPIGISLSDAESVLRFAGFRVYPLDLREWDGSRSPILARAMISPFEKHLFYTYYSSIKFELYQDDIDKRDKVGRVRAEVTMPMS